MLPTVIDFNYSDGQKEFSVGWAQEIKKHDDNKVLE